MKGHFKQMGLKACAAYLTKQTPNQNQLEKMNNHTSYEENDSLIACHNSKDRLIEP